ncbi:MAG: glutathione S-transferase [Burkholderiaceae bacterium]
MLTLCGFPVSNYYNKVKLALLEKSVPFSEEYVKTGSTEEAVLSASPLAKIPYIKTEQGGLCESQAIMDYIEAKWPHPPLLPTDAFAAAKVRELIIFIDQHLEMLARELYGQAFFGKSVSQEIQTRVRQQLEKNIAGFKRLVHFSPYIAGAEFTQADCSAFVSLPVIGMATKAIYGEDLLVAGGVDYKAYLKLIGERSSAQKVVADRKASQAK